MVQHMRLSIFFATVFFLDIFTAHKKINMKFFKLIIAVAFLPVFAHAQIIKLNLPKDTKYEVSTVTKVTSIASIMGQEMESGSDISTVETIKVKDTRAGETDLVSTITRITANVQAMGQATVYDSDKKDNDATAEETFGKMKGKDKNITVDIPSSSPTKNTIVLTFA